MTQTHTAHIDNGLYTICFGIFPSINSNARFALRLHFHFAVKLLIIREISLGMFKESCKLQTKLISETIIIMNNARHSVVIHGLFDEEKSKSLITTAMESVLR